LIRFTTENGARIQFVTRLLVAAYLVEAGLLLVIAPWTALWDRNIFAVWLPWLGSAMSSRHVQGAVTGVGLITVLAGLRDLTGAFFSRSSAAAPPPDNPTPAP
jgi:hypothetical protein